MKLDLELCSTKSMPTPKIKIYEVSVFLNRQCKKKTGKVSTPVQREPGVGRSRRIIIPESVVFWNVLRRNMNGFKKGG